MCSLRDRTFRPLLSDLAKTSPEHSTLVLQRESTPGRFELQLVAFDMLRRPRTVGGDKWDITCTPLRDWMNPASDVPHHIRIVDNGNGSYTFVVTTTFGDQFNVGVCRKGYAQMISIKLRTTSPSALTIKRIDLSIEALPRLPKNYSTIHWGASASDDDKNIHTFGTIKSDDEARDKRPELGKFCAEYGIPGNGSDHDVRREFRKLMLELHPDRPLGDSIKYLAVATAAHRVDLIRKQLLEFGRRVRTDQV